MAKALKIFVVPKIKALGFSGTFPHFRRAMNDKFEFLSFQFNRHGGSFILECGFAKVADLPEFAKDFPFEKLNYGLAPAKNRIRIKPDGIDQEDFWFAYDSFAEENQFDELAKSVSVLLPKIEKFFRLLERVNGR